MSWARYDDELSMNKKVGRLRAKGVDGIAAIGLHLLANTYCRHNGTAGEVEAHVPELLAGKCGPKLARLLAEVGMFDVTESGWSIHDFEEFHDPTDPDPNRSAADRKRELSEKRAAAGRAGGLAKAGKDPSKPLANPGSATASDLANGWQNPSPGPGPDPGPTGVSTQQTDRLPTVAAVGQSVIEEALNLYGKHVHDLDPDGCTTTPARRIAGIARTAANERHGRIAQHMSEHPNSTTAELLAGAFDLTELEVWRLTGQARRKGA